MIGDKTNMRERGIFVTPGILYLLFGCNSCSKTSSSNNIQDILYTVTKPAWSPTLHCPNEFHSFELEISIAVGEKNASIAAYILSQGSFRELSFYGHYNTSEQRIHWWLISLSTRLSGSGTRADVKLFQKWKVIDSLNIFLKSSCCWALSVSVEGAEKYLVQHKLIKQ